MHSDEQESDLAVIRAILDGDREQFHHLVQRHKQYLFGLIYRQIGDHPTAEDLTQESFVRAFRSLAKFKAASSFRTWITSIAMNVTNSYFSSARFRERKRSDSFDPVLHDRAVDPQANSISPAIIDSFRAGLAKLSPRLREVLVLCALEGKSYEEVATIVGIPIGTVRSRLNSARLALKNIVSATPLEESSHE